MQYIKRQGSIALMQIVLHLYLFIGNALISGKIKNSWAQGRNYHEFKHSSVLLPSNLSADPLPWISRRLRILMICLKQCVPLWRSSMTPHPLATLLTWMSQMVIRSLIFCGGSFREFLTDIQIWPYLAIVISSFPGISLSYVSFRMKSVAGA